jgi:pantetheine-phosphate adenylyltransferase
VSRVAVYTGSFDPPTLGHLDVIRRAAALVDRLVVGVGANAAKAPIFSQDERVARVRRETAEVQGVEVKAFDGLAVAFARAEGAGLIVRGLRSAADFDYEAPMAAMNRAMAGEIETIFLPADPALAAITASLVRDVARGRGAVERFVSAGVAADLRARMDRG